jgi:hypothetical protein
MDGNGWYYRQDGEKAGPVSAVRLKELLASGLLQPRQAVWTHGGDRLLFLPAVTAAASDPRSVGS